MEKRLQCIVHHGGEFSKEFYKLIKWGYKGLKEIWDIVRDYWSYFEILGKLKDLGYPVVASLWYYDEMDVNDIVLLENDKGSRMMKTIIVMVGTCHLYVIHHLSQPDIIEEYYYVKYISQRLEKGYHHVWSTVVS